MSAASADYIRVLDTPILRGRMIADSDTASTPFVTVVNEAALSATRSSIAQLVLRQGGLLVGVGLAAGLALALAGGRLVKSFLYQVQPLDGFTYCAVVLALALIGFLAILLSARRGASIEPM